MIRYGNVPELFWIHCGIIYDQKRITGTYAVLYSKASSLCVHRGDRNTEQRIAHSCWAPGTVRRTQCGQNETLCKQFVRFVLL